MLENLTLIIPTKDDHESIYKNIQEIYDFLCDYTKEYEILIVSNGSSINSISKIDKLLKNYNNTKHIVLKEKGKGLAIREGLKGAKYSNTLFVDADMSVKIHEFKKFIKNGRLLSGFVLVSRKLEKSINLNSPLLRQASGAIYSQIVKWMFSINFNDTNCGFKAIDKNIFLNCDEFTLINFSFDLELVLLANKLNIETNEIPVTYIHDRSSSVKILRDSLSMFKDLFILKKRY
jgi:dolichyl-phosphate beta-glucosyltransferase